MCSSEKKTSATRDFHCSYVLICFANSDLRPVIEVPQDKVQRPETVWCQKRYETDAKTRKHSAGSLWAFHDCGYPFPPQEMVGPESLTQVVHLQNMTQVFSVVLNDKASLKGSISVDYDAVYSTYVSKCVGYGDTSAGVPLLSDAVCGLRDAGVLLLRLHVWIGPIQPGMHPMRQAQVPRHVNDRW